MNKKEKQQAREELRKWAIKWSGCAIQQGRGDNKSYPCGTCFNAMLGSLIDEDDELYREHNDEVDRINEVWRFLLQLRDEEYKN